MFPKHSLHIPLLVAPLQAMCQRGYSLNLLFPSHSPLCSQVLCQRGLFHCNTNVRRLVSSSLLPHPPLLVPPILVVCQRGLFHCNSNMRRLVSSSLLPDPPLLVPPILVVCQRGLCPKPSPHPPLHASRSCGSVVWPTATLTCGVLC
jgi:hypothetical protein